MGSTAVSNPAGASGLAGSYDQVVEQWVNGEASATIARGELVMAKSTNGQVLRATTAATSDIILVGVAAEDIPAGRAGLVVTKGLVDWLICDYANPAAGDILTIPASTTGRAGKLTVATTSLGRAIGVVSQGATQAAGLAVPGAYIQKF